MFSEFDAGIAYENNRYFWRVGIESVQKRLRFSLEPCVCRDAMFFIGDRISIVKNKDARRESSEVHDCSTPCSPEDELLILPVNGRKKEVV